jgi:hypothetical protein
MIWKLVLSHKDIRLKMCLTLKGNSARHDSKHPKGTGPNNIALLYVCRQIHSDAALLPYALNMFSVWGPHMGLFLERRLPAQISVMTAVRNLNPYGFRAFSGTATEWLWREEQESWEWRTARHDVIWVRRQNRNSSV